MDEPGVLTQLIHEAMQLEATQLAHLPKPQPLFFSLGPTPAKWPALLIASKRTQAAKEATHVILGLGSVYFVFKKPLGGDVKHCELRPINRRAVERVIKRLEFFDCLAVIIYTRP